MRPRRIRRLFLFFAIACAIVTAAFAVSAQQVPRRGAATTAPPATLAPVRTAAAPRTFAVPLNKARVIDLAVAAASVVVANETVADIHIDPANPRKVFVIARAIGSTSIFFMDGEGGVIEQAEVRVDLDPAALKAAFTKLLPDESIEVSVFQGSVFLTGSVRSAAAVADAANIAIRFVETDTSVVNMLQIRGSQQVVLQVRIAEMSRTIIKNLSVNQRFSRGVGKRNTDFTTTSPTPANAVTAFATGALDLRLAGLGIGGVTFEVMERQGLVKTLAEPTLTAVSGETANFLSGGEFPFPVGRDENGNTTYEFREYGIGLNFTPVVLNEGRINLQIATEVSDVDTSTTITIGTDQIPSFTTKRTETTIDLPSGGGLMISGLLEENMSDTVAGFPVLKDIPILGALFRSSEYQREETELVVLVNAFLAKPVDGGAGLTAPHDGLIPPSDVDMYLLGRLHKEYTSQGEVPFTRLPFSIEGPFGYIMEKLP